MAPAFFAAKMTLFVGRNLYPEKLLGDEPEPLEIVPWKLGDADALLAQPDFTEARSVAALLLLQRYLNGQSTGAEHNGIGVPTDVSKEGSNFG